VTSGLRAGPLPPRRTAGGKLLAVLDAFTRERPALTLSEIARAVGVPLSTAHRLVAELCAWGGVERDEDGRYRVGLRVWELGALAPRGLGLREAALPFMPTGVGLVLLAHAPVEVQEEVLARPLVGYTRHTITDPGQLRRVLAEVRRSGVAISDRQVTGDAVSVAAPVEVRGSVVAALSIVVRGSSPSAVRPYIPGVRAAARGIGRTLASTP
jgi:DNA-binding IclR family transcriptional regulator